jgi:hypothetical protein
LSHNTFRAILKATSLNPHLIKTELTLIINKEQSAIEKKLFLPEGDCEMSKKGETGEQDRGKPQPRKKKEREDARKKKKLDRAGRQQSRQA